MCHRSERGFYNRQNIEKKRMTVGQNILRGHLIIMKMVEHPDGRKEKSVELSKAILVLFMPLVGIVM